jgi:hypothetical protein
MGLGQKNAIIAEIRRYNATATRAKIYGCASNQLTLPLTMRFARH